jgi:hypothetical protein
MANVKLELAAQGVDLIKRMCVANGWKIPAIKAHVPGGGSCGLYERRTVHVDASACAGKGYGGPAWSWPGYIIDRTPYGVHAHELGHYVDELMGGRMGIFSRRLRKLSGEEPLTGYCPNTEEWWAEIFRLFVTNPDLLHGVRPLAYRHIHAAGLKPVEERPWRTVLQGAPERTLAMAQRRLQEAAR